MNPLVLVSGLPPQTLVRMIRFFRFVRTIAGWILAVGILGGSSVQAQTNRWERVLTSKELRACIWPK